MDSLEEKLYREACSEPGGISQENMEKMYHMFMEYENSLHMRNLKRIKIGIRCIWIIPAIFLFLMFFTGSSKVIFLTLWIVSLFCISVYLIWIEYIDYNLQQKLNEIHGNEDGEIASLIEMPELVEERVLQAVERIDDSDLLNFDVDLRIEEKKEQIAEKMDERKEAFAGKKDAIAGKIVEHKDRKKKSEGEEKDEEHN